jgi:hypothetical protein
MQIQRIETVEHILDKHRDDVRGLRMHDGILAVRVQQDFVQAHLHCARAHELCSLRTNHRASKFFISSLEISAETFQLKRPERALTVHPVRSTPLSPLLGGIGSFSKADARASVDRVEDHASLRMVDREVA